nr:ABC transporter permease [Mediterraneibacter glycyrrhizinilyticus]
MQSELFRIRKKRLFWACLALAAFFVFALALTFYHTSVNGMLPAISLVSFTEFLFSDYSLIFPLTLFLCLYFTEDFHAGTYSIALSKGTSRVHLFFGKLLVAWIGVLFFLFICFGVAYLFILVMGVSRYDIEYSFSAIGAFLFVQCLCFLGYTTFLNLLSYLLRHRIIVTITAFFLLGILYLYLTKISAALDMDYSLYKYWVVGLSHSLQINSFTEDLMPICVTLAVYLLFPTALSFSLFQRLDLRGLERR